MDKEVVRMIKKMKTFVNELLKEPWIFTSWMIMIGGLVAYVWGSA